MRAAKKYFYEHWHDKLIYRRGITGLGGGGGGYCLLAFGQKESRQGCLLR